MGDTQNELVPVGDNRSKGLRKVVDRVRSLAGLKELDVEQARSILQLVVNTSENTITESTNVNRLGPYSAKDVRNALKVVSQDVITRHNNSLEYDSPTFSVLSKRINTGEPLRFAVYRDDKSKLREVSLQLGEGNEKMKFFTIVAHVPAAEPKEELEKFYAGTFVDHRPGHEAYAQLYVGTNLEEFRKSWLGFRWVAENLLRWDEGFKFPEELGPKQSQLNPGPSNKVLPSTT